MPIKVNISISAGGRFKPVSSHTLHEKRVTIGRDKECTLTLADTQKHVSRTHAEFEEKDGAYWLKVVSKVNPVIVNGKRHMFGDRIAMNEGDHISIGLYKLEIVEARVAPPARVEPPKHAEPRPEDITYVASRSAFPSGIPSPQSPPPEIAALKEEDTFVPAAKPAAPVAPPPKAAPPAAALPDAAAEAEEDTYVPPVAVAPPPPPPPPPAPAIKTALPDTAFADDEVTYIPPMWARPASARTPPADAVSGADDTASEDMTNFRRPPVEPRAPAAEANPPVVETSLPIIEPSPPPVVESSDAVDFDLSDALEEEATLRPQTAPATAAPPAPPEPTPPESKVEEDFSEDLTYVRRPSTPMPTRSPTPPPAAAPEIPAYSEAERLADEETHYRVAPKIGPRAAAGASTAAAGGALQAFLEGAGLAGITVADPEKFMRDTGIMVRAAVEGVMMLLLARAEARKELGAEPDSPAGDNPLSSMANPAEVIEFLFDPNRPAIGDTDPVQAFGDACGDLRAHQVALLAGMRAAVLGALERLDPKKIEREHGINLGGLNLTRKSKLWDIAAAQHEQLTHETEENFSATFGREILAAYTAQLRKMRGGR